MTSIEDCLHPERPGMKLVNVKFFRGDNRYITPEEFRAKLCAAAEFQRANPHIRRGEAPRSTKPKVNVRERVANL
ncbi:MULTISPECIES: hypothetical protein [Rhizobium]|uniref:Uncharacterized protein n=1 Tax=Rhizobium aouanii TaxID=3118145 RepID=A0ABU8CK50_9HYPH|nr:hypothetical protein [Rhizobium laguerreae]MBY3524919.1 hypothetical protein [Rhizobium laguerreae]